MIEDTISVEEIVEKSSMTAGQMAVALEVLMAEQGIDHDTEAGRMCAYLKAMEKERPTYKH